MEPKAPVDQQSPPLEATEQHQDSQPESQAAAPSKDSSLAQADLVKNETTSNTTGANHLLNDSSAPQAATEQGIIHVKPKIKSFQPKLKADDGAESIGGTYSAAQSALESQAANASSTNSEAPANAAASTGIAPHTASTEASAASTSAHAAQAEPQGGPESEQAAVYDGSQTSEKEQENHPPRKRVFLRSLQFRIIWIVVLAGLISMTIMSILSYYKITQITHDFVDEELSQIASVAINYRMIIPRRWEAPRHYHDRIMNLIRTADGSIVVQLSSEERNRRIQELTNEATTWFDDQIQQAQPRQGTGQGKGMGQGMGRMHNQGTGASASTSQAPAASDQAGLPSKTKPNIAQPNGTPSLSDLSGLNYDIMIAPLFGRPGDALYIPLGVSDGFYTVMVADERVRAFVATNANGQRFVVARPLSSLTDLIKQSFYASFSQFFWIDLIGIPLIIILSVNFMLRSLNRIAQDLYHRSEEDLSPVVAHDVSGTKGAKGFIPSELDGFIISINRLFQRVDESMQSKRRFIADAAHEMRTQSTVLSLQIAALDNEELSPSARKKIQRLKEGIAREKSLMTSLLTLAREQGCSDLSLENINIFELYTKLIEEQGLLADSKNIDLGVEGEVNYNVISDRSRLTRIMSNLLSNAIKYTPEDGRIDLKAEQMSDGSLVLTVQDDGPGIPPEHMKHILEPFYRVDGDRSAVQGTGLGLAIVKASCDSLKAQLKFANATPHGLIASVTIKDLKPHDLKDS